MVNNGDAKRRFFSGGRFVSEVLRVDKPRAYGSMGVLHLARTLFVRRPSTAGTTCCREALFGRVLSTCSPIGNVYYCFASVQPKRCHVCTSHSDSF